MDHGLLPDWRGLKVSRKRRVRVQGLRVQGTFRSCREVEWMMHCRLLPLQPVMEELKTSDGGGLCPCLWQVWQV